MTKKELRERIEQIISDGDIPDEMFFDKLFYYLREFIK